MEKGKDKEKVREVLRQGKIIIRKGGARIISRCLMSIRGTKGIIIQLLCFDFPTGARS